MRNNSFLCCPVEGRQLLNILQCWMRELAAEIAMVVSVIQLCACALGLIIKVSHARAEGSHSHMQNKFWRGNTFTVASDTKDTKCQDLFFLSAEGEGLWITFGSCGLSGLPTVAAVNCTWDLLSFENMWVFCSALLLTSGDQSPGPTREMSDCAHRFAVCP